MELPRAVDQALAKLQSEQRVDSALVNIAAATQRWSLDYASQRALQTTVRQLLEQDHEITTETAVSDAVSEWQAVATLLAEEAARRQLGPNETQQPDWLKIPYLIKRCDDQSSLQTREEVVSVEVDRWEERQRRNREMQKTEQSVWDASEIASSGKVAGLEPVSELEQAASGTTSQPRLRVDGVTVGIDLGTSTCCVCHYRDGQAHVIPNDQGNRTTPAYVAFTDSGRLIGEAAKNQAAMNPSNTVFDVLRLVGRKFSDASVQSDAKHWPFKIVDKLGLPAIQLDYKGETKLLWPVKSSRCC